MKRPKYNEILNTFIGSFDNGTNCLYYFNDQSIPRGFGKTTILNEIGLLAQFYNYEVLIWTPYNNIHFATERIDRYDQLRSRHIKNGILLIDEIDISDDENFQMLRDLIDSGILILGLIKGEWK